MRDFVPCVGVDRVLTATAHRWDDNRLRSYLEEKGVLETKAQASRNELLARMRDAYAKITEPIWHAWSDSCIVSFPIMHCPLETLTLTLTRRAA